MPVTPIDGSRWEELVLGPAGPVLVQFWRRTCPICAAMERDVERLAAELEGKVPFYRVDCDTEPDLIWAYEVLGTPTFIAFCGSEPVGRLAGDVAISQVRSLVMVGPDGKGPCGKVG